MKIYIALLLSCLFLLSCTAGISLGRYNKVEQTITNMVDSVETTFSIIPYNK